MDKKRSRSEANSPQAEAKKKILTEEDKRSFSQAVTNLLVILLALSLTSTLTYVSRPEKKDITINNNEQDDDQEPDDEPQEPEEPRNSNPDPDRADYVDDLLNNLGAGSGEITVTLMWRNSDDVDLHVETPDGGEVYFGCRDYAGGTLDIDANFDVMMTEPVENIYFASPNTGTYSVYIEDFTDRNDEQTSYMVRVTVGDRTRVYEGHIDGSGTINDIITFTYSG